MEWVSYSRFSCREKKDVEVQNLEGKKHTEGGDIEYLSAENQELRENLAKLKSHYAKVLEFAKKNNIQLRQRNVPMNSSALGSSSSAAAGGASVDRS